MKIVIDTNVVISGIFFGGYPGKVIEAVAGRHIEAFATPEIVKEYEAVIDEMILRKQGKFGRNVLTTLLSCITIIPPESDVHVCRDPDDDKFIACAQDAKAAYIVSGDKDLLDIKGYKEIRMITARDFCDVFLNKKES